MKMICVDIRASVFADCCALIRFRRAEIKAALRNLDREEIELDAAERVVLRLRQDGISEIMDQKEPSK